MVLIKDAINISYKADIGKSRMRLRGRERKTSIGRRRMRGKNSKSIFKTLTSGTEESSLEIKRHIVNEQRREAKNKSCICIDGLLCGH